MMTNRLTRTWLNMALALFSGLGVVDESTAGAGATTTPAGEGSTAAAGTAAGSEGTAPAGTALGGTPPAGEPAAGAAKPGAEGAAAKAADGAPVVPEAYEFKLPEGVQLDTARAEAFSTIAKDLKLTQEQAQKLVDLDVKRAQDQAAEHAATVQEWTQTLKADKEFGGDNLPATLASCKQVMDTFASPELRAYLDVTGLGNHPDLVRMVAKIGNAMGEDVFVKGGNTTPTSKSIATTMYPSSNMNP